MKTKLFTLFLALATSVGTMLGSVTIDGITYSLYEANLTADVIEGNYAGSVIIPDSFIYDSKTYSVTGISSSAFASCKYLTSVTIGNNVTNIANSSFKECWSLTSVTIGSRVTSIGMYAFEDCIRLTSVTIPNSVTDIGDYAFKYCSSLTSVTIPNSVTSIGSKAFADCYIESINFTGTLEDWCNKAWLLPNVSSHRYQLLLNGELQENVTIPNSVTSIKNWAFYNCNSLISVTIPDSVTSIGSSAFSGCSSLTSVTIPNSVKSIGTSAFSDCHITSINFIGTMEDWCNKTWKPSDISKGYQLLLNGDLQENVTIPNGVTSIGNSAFSGCSSLTSVIIPDGVTSIGNSAFSGCSSLTSVTIPNSVTSIEDGTFSGCSSLISVIIPDGVTSIGYSAFSGCSSLISVIIPDGVTSIGSHAFENCRSLTSVTIPNSVTSIGYSAFKDVPNIVYLGSDDNFWSNPFIYGARCINGFVDGWLVYNNESKTTLRACSAAATGEMIIPNSVTSIQGSAFYGCSSLISVTIGNSVTNIEYSTFEGCSSLNFITIGESVKTIAKNAFYGCKSIKTITCYSMRPPTIKDNSGNAFDIYDYSSVIVYVPADYLTYYLVHDAWGLFDVRPIGAASVETNEVKIEPTTSTANVVWPAVSGAATYELVIKDKQGNIICTLIFNANGQLTSIAFNAPARDNSAEQVQEAGFSFTVTGLDSGTTYDLTITAKDSNGQTLQTTTQAFTTEGLTGVDDVVTNIAPSKVIRNGQLFILRGDKTYTVQGQEVR